MRQFVALESLHDRWRVEITVRGRGEKGYEEGERRTYAEGIRGRGRCGERRTYVYEYFLVYTLFNY